MKELTSLPVFAVVMESSSKPMTRAAAQRMRDELRQGLSACLEGIRTAAAGVSSRRADDEVDSQTDSIGDTLASVELISEEQQSTVSSGGVGRIIQGSVCDGCGASFSPLQLHECHLVS